MATDLKKIERRTIQYWFDDGIWELAFGLWILFLGICLFGFVLIPGKPFWRALGWVALLAAVIFSARFVARTVRRLKEKWTYPRAGFVSYRRPDGQERPRRFSWRGGLFGAVFALAYSFLWNSGRFWWVLFILGLVSALTFFYVAVRTGLVRFFFLSVFIFAAGFILAGSGLKALFGLSLFGCFEGFALSFSGAVTLKQFIKKNPVLEKEEP